jgi:hypothetical protein
MLKNYKTDLIAIGVVFCLIGYGINVSLAKETVTTKPVVVTAKKAEKAEPAKKATLTPSKKKEAAKPAEPKKDPNRKKPTLKKKYADKK